MRSCWKTALSEWVVDHDGRPSPLIVGTGVEPAVTGQNTRAQSKTCCRLQGGGKLEGGAIAMGYETGAYEDKVERGTRSKLSYASPGQLSRRNDQIVVQSTLPKMESSKQQR